MSEIIEKPTDIEINNAHRYRDKMDPTSEAGSVIEIFYRAWKTAKGKTRKVIGKNSGIPIHLNPGISIPPTDPVPPEIDARDLEAYRYQVAGQKAELEAKVDFIQEIRQAMSAPPTASLLHFIQGFMAEVLKSRADRDVSNGFGEMLDKISAALGQESGEDITLVAKDRQEKAEKFKTIGLILLTKPEESIPQAVQDLVNKLAKIPKPGETYDATIRQKIYDLLDGKPGETLTDAATRVMAELAEATDSQGLAAAISQVRAVLGIEPGKDVVAGAADITAELADAEARATAAKDPELIEKLRRYCRDFRKTANCPVCHGIASHSGTCQFAEAVLE